MEERRWFPCFVDGDYEGYITVQQMEETKKKFRENAVKVLNESGADHVVYFCKEYGDDGSIVKASFYSGKTFRDKDFDAVAAMRNVIIGAVHKR